MTNEHRMEQLSRAYVQAVAAICGCTYARPEPDYGVDMTVRRVAQIGGRWAPIGRSLDLQLKSTSVAEFTDDHVVYDLDAHAYDLLRRATRNAPLVLVLLALPSERAEWLVHSEDRLELRRCAYWLSLRREPSILNSRSVRVAIPRQNQFTPAALERIMDALQREEDLR
jgi:hypothetical protein